MTIMLLVIISINFSDLTQTVHHSLHVSTSYCKQWTFSVNVRPGLAWNSAASIFNQSNVKSFARVTPLLSPLLSSITSSIRWRDCYCTLQAGQQASLRSGRGQKSICLTISANSSSTMVLLLADVSMKGQPQSSANAWPSLGDTSLSSSRSTLLPTSTTGTCWYLGKTEKIIAQG